VRLREANYEGVLEFVSGFEGAAEAAEEFVIFFAVLIGEDDEGGRGESVLKAVHAAAFFTFDSLGSAKAAVAAVGFTLSFGWHAFLSKG